MGVFDRSSGSVCSKIKVYIFCNILLPIYNKLFFQDPLILKVGGIYSRSPGGGKEHFTRTRLEVAYLSPVGVEGSEDSHRKPRTSYSWTNAPSGKDMGERAILAQTMENEEELVRRFPKRVGEHPMVGENLFLEGGGVDDLCIGDVFSCYDQDGQHRDLVLQVTSPRRPCSAFDETNGRKFGYPYGKDGIRYYCSCTGTCGLFFKVVFPGNLRKGDELRLIVRPNPTWTLRKVANLLYIDAPSTYKMSRFNGTDWELDTLSSMRELAWAEWGEEVDKLVRLRRD